jgi:hypothetical protein
MHASAGLEWVRWLLGRRAGDKGPGGPVTASAPADRPKLPEYPAGGATAYLLARRAADDSARIRAGSLSPDVLVSWGIPADPAACAGPAGSPRGPGGEC